MMINIAVAGLGYSDGALASTLYLKLVVNAPLRSSKLGRVESIQLKETHLHDLFSPLVTHVEVRLT